MKIQPNIRHAIPTDIDQIVALCEAHANYEEVTYESKEKRQRLASALFSEKPKLYCLVADIKGVLVGYVTYMKQYATWDADEYIYMDCLYLKEYARGSRIGEKLVRRIQEEGKKMGCSHVQWQTPDFNTRAIKFYKRIGASSKPKERFFLDIY